MIYLYDSTETDFRYNGKPLPSAYDVDVQFTLNGEYYAVGKYPLGENNIYKEIIEDRIVKVHTMDGMQPFRIVNVSKHELYVEFEAWPLFYADMRNKLVKPLMLRGVGGQIALNAFVNNLLIDTPFNFYSDITETHDYHTQDEDERESNPKQLYNALDVLKDIVNRWGGELWVRGYDIRVNDRIGTDTEAMLYEKKNISEFVDTTNIEGIVTRLHGITEWTGEREEGQDEAPEHRIETTIESPLINNYSGIIFEKQYRNNDTRTKKELEDWLRLKFTTENIDKPQRSIEVGTHIIDGTSVKAGDTLVLKYIKHDVDVRIKVVGYEYDGFANEVKQIILGEPKSTSASTIGNTITDLVNNSVAPIDRKTTIAMNSASGKNTNYHGTENPNDLGLPAIENDTYFRTNGSEKEIWRFTGTLWELIMDTSETTKNADAIEKTLEEVEEAKRQAKLDAEQASADAKAHAEAEDARIRGELESEISGAVDLAEQAKADVVTKANQALVDAKAHADAEVQASKEHFDSLIEDVEADVTNAQATADSAVEQIDTAVVNAGFTSLDETISYIDTISNNAQSNAQQAINDASNAFSDAQSALSGLDDKLDTSVYNATLLDLEAGIDSAITAGNTAKETAEGLITQVGDIGTVANSALQEAKDAVGTANTAKASADNLSTEVSGLKTDVEGFELTVNNYQDQVSQFSADVNGFQSTVASYETEVDEFGNIVSTNTTQLNELRNDIDGFEILLASYDTDLDGFNTTVSSFRSTLEGLESTVANYETEVDEYGNEVATYATELSTLRNTVNGFESTVAEFDTTVTGYQTSLATLTNTVDGFESTVANYEVQVDEYGNQVSSYATEVATLENTVSGFNSLVASFELEAEGYSAEVSEFRNTVSGLQSTVARYEVELDEYGNTVDSYATQVATFNNTVDGLESSVAAYEQSVSGYATQLATLTNTVDGFNSTVTSYETQLDEYGAEVNQYATQVSTLNNTVNGFESTVAEVRSDFENMEIGGRNYFSLSSAQKNRGIVTIPVEPNTDYIVSSNVPVPTGGTTLYFNGITTSTDGVWVGNSIVKNSGNQETMHVHIYPSREYTSELMSGEYKIMWEKGNKATDWTPAPEDMATATQVSTLSNTVDGLESTVGNYQTELIGYRGDVTQYKNQVSTMQNTVNGFNNTVAQYTTEVDEFGNEIASYATQVSTLENTVDGFRSSVDKVEQDYAGVSGTVATHTSEISNMSGQIALKANTTTVNALTGRVSTAETGISTNAGAIKLKANTTTVNALTGRVSTAETGITANATAIGLKASQSSVDTLTGTVSTLSGRVDVTAGQISSKVWNTDIQTAVDGIEVGGRNLTLNSDTVWQSAGLYASYTLSEAFNHGDTFTIQIKGQLAEDRDNFAIYMGSVHTNIIEMFLHRSHIVNGVYTRTITINNPTIKDFKNLRVYVQPYSRPGITTIEWIKLEKGNIATDWTPAPEDTTALINHVESELTQKHDSIVATVSSVDGRVATNKLSLDGLTTTVQGVRTDLDGTTTLLNTTRTTVSGHTSTIATLRTDVNGKATTAQFNTLNSTVNGTITRVGNAEGKITQIETSVSGLQTTVASKASQSQVTQLANAVDTKVTSSQVNALIKTDKTVKDTRSTNETPTWYQSNYSRETVREFKSLSVMGISGEGSFGLLETKIPWTNSSGGGIKQTLTTDHAVHERSGTTSWSKWKKTADVDWVGSQVTVLENNINLRVQKGDVLSQINIEAERTLIQSNRLVLDANSVVFTGSAFIPSAQIQSLHADKINAGTINTARLNTTEIVTQGLTANVVKSTHIETSTATIDKLFATNAMVNRLTAKTAFISSVKAVDIDAARITSGTINAARLNASAIVTAGLTANVIKSTHISADTALFDKLFSTSSATTRLSAQTAWIKNGMFANASIDGAKIQDATIGSAKISSLDVGKISGNTTNFVQSAWNSAVGGNVNIDGGGVRTVDQHGDTAYLRDGGLDFFDWQSREIGSIGVGYEVNTYKRTLGIYLEENSIFKLSKKGNFGGEQTDNQSAIYSNVFGLTSDNRFYLNVPLIIESHSLSSIQESGYNTLRIRAGSAGRWTLGAGTQTQLSGATGSITSQVRITTPSIAISGGGGHNLYNSNDTIILETNRFSVLSRAGVSFMVGNPYAKALSIFADLNMNGHTISNSPSVSDARLKDVQGSRVEHDLEKLMQIEYVNFRWKDEKYGSQDLGFIAQQVQSVAPELITKVAGGMLGFNQATYLNFIGHSVQELALRELNTNQVATQALQATETNEEKIHKLQQELSKANRRIEELEGAI